VAALDPRAVFDPLATSYDRFDDSPIAKRLVHLISSRLQLCLPPGSRIADVGCGPGTLALRLASSGLRVTAVDISQPMLEVAADRARSAQLPLETCIHDLREGPVPGGPYDGMTATMGPLNYSPNPRPMMQNLRASTCTGGRLWLGLARGAQLPTAFRHPSRLVVPLARPPLILDGSVGGQALAVYLWDPRSFVTAAGPGWELRRFQAVGIVRSASRLVDSVVGRLPGVRHFGSVTLMELEAS
jgi:SAM-dependent methyltransferase